MSRLEGVLALVAAWVAIGGAGLLRPRDVRWAGRVLFVLGAIVAAALAALSFQALGAGETESLTLPIGLPDLPFHLRLDPLAAMFLLLIGTTAVGVSIYSA